MHATPYCLSMCICSTSVLESFLHSAIESITRSVKHKSEFALDGMSKRLCNSRKNRRTEIDLCGHIGNFTCTCGFYPNTYCNSARPEPSMLLYVPPLANNNSRILFSFHQSNPLPRDFYLKEPLFNANQYSILKPICCQ